MTKMTIGIIGAGKLGITLGNLAISAGYNVFLSSSKPVKKIKLTVETLVPGAKAATNEEISERADIIILALPLSKYKMLSPTLFAGKIVLDAMNYWWEVDGLENIYSDDKASSSEKVAAYFDRSKLVKAFNHISYHNLADYANQDDGHDRIVVLYATDEEATIELVATLINNFGFHAQYIGKLANGRILETGYPLFGASMDAETITPIVNKSLAELR